VLSDKGGVIFHRGLFAVICGLGVGQSDGDKVACVVEGSGKSFLFEVFGFFAGKAEPAAKAREAEGSKKFVYVFHRRHYLLKKKACGYPHRP